MTLSRRPLLRSDVPAWARLLAAVNEADGDLQDASEVGLRDTFDSPEQAYEKGSLGVFDGPALAGYGVLSPRPSAGRVHNMRYQGAVHPSYRGRGIGADLLSWAEAAAIPLHGSWGQLNLDSGCVSTNEAAAALHRSRGYHPARVFHTMVRDLSAPLASADLQDGLRVEEFADAVSEDARFVRNEAFRDHWGSVESSPERWAHSVGSATFRPRYSFVVYEGSEPLAVLLCSDHSGDLYIGLVGTRAAGRGRGIATALLTRAMARARADGFRTASLHVDSGSFTGAVGVYERVGFLVKVSWTVYRKELIP